MWLPAAVLFLLQQNLNAIPMSVDFCKNDTETGNEISIVYFKSVKETLCKCVISPTTPAVDISDTIINVTSKFVKNASEENGGYYSLLFNNGTGSTNVTNMTFRAKEKILELMWKEDTSITFKTENISISPKQLFIKLETDNRNKFTVACQALDDVNVSPTTRTVEALSPTAPTTMYSTSSTPTHNLPHSGFSTPKTTPTIIGVSVGGSLLALTALVLCIFIYRRRKRAKDTLSSGSQPSRTASKIVPHAYDYVTVTNPGGSEEAKEVTRSIADNSSSRVDNGMKLDITKPSTTENYDVLAHNQKGSQPAPAQLSYDHVTTQSEGTDCYDHSFVVKTGSSHGDDYDTTEAAMKVVTQIEGSDDYCGYDHLGEKTNQGVAQNVYDSTHLISD